MATLLIVDDEAPLRTVFGMALEFANYRCKSADGAKRALEMVTSERFDLILLDLDMPGMGGMEVLGKLRKEGDPTKVVLMSAGTPSRSILQEAKCLGAETFLAKPMTLETLREVIAGALKRG